MDRGTNHYIVQQTKTLANAGLADTAFAHRLLFCQSTLEAFYKGNPLKTPPPL